MTFTNSSFVFLLPFHILTLHSCIFNEKCTWINSEVFNVPSLFLQIIYFCVLHWGSIYIATFFCEWTIDRIFCPLNLELYLSNCWQFEHLLNLFTWLEKNQDCTWRTCPGLFIQCIAVHSGRVIFLCIPLTSICCLWHFSFEKKNDHTM